MLRHLLYITPFTGGSGHIVRGLSIIRALRRRGWGGRATIVAPDTTMVLPDPIHAMFPQVGATLVHLVGYVGAVSTDAEMPRILRDSTYIHELERLRPDAIVVDSDWRDTAPASAEVAPVTLTVRYVRDPWWYGFRGHAPNVTSVGIEPLVHPNLIHRFVDPLVATWDARPLLSGDTYSHRLPLRDEDRAVVAGLSMAAPRIAATGDRVWVVSSNPNRLWKLADQQNRDPVWVNLPWAWDFLRQVDGPIVASAGYVSYWTAHYFGLAPRVQWVPDEMTAYDDQRIRIKHARTGSFTNGADALAGMLLGES